MIWLPILMILSFASNSGKVKLDIPCDPASQQTYCRVFCKEQNCDSGYCSDAGNCECSQCEEKTEEMTTASRHEDCSHLQCHSHGRAMEVDGECECVCTDGWEGERCELQPEWPAIPDGFKGLPNHRCEDYEEIDENVLSVEDCLDRYNQQDDYNMGFFLDCYQANRLDGATMKCQACTTVEVTTSGKECGSYTFQPVLDCNPSCLNDGICHEDGHCLCTDEYYGDHCQDRIPEDKCMDVHCQHGGICYAGVCQNCEDGWTGDLCAEEDNCASVFCNEPHGYCDDGVCHCKSGFGGLHCQVWESSEQTNEVVAETPKKRWFVFLLVLIAISFVGGWGYMYFKWQNEYKAFGDYTELVSYQNYGGAPDTIGQSE